MATPTTETKAQSINHESKGEWLQTRPGERCLIRIPAAETNGAYSVVEIVSDPRDGTPMHIHQNEDEHFMILEGTARIASGDKTFDAAAGTAVTLGKGVPHAWCNLSNSPLRMVVISSPGGIEEILRLIAKGGDIDIMALAKRFGVRNVGPMPSSQDDIFPSAVGNWDNKYDKWPVPKILASIAEWNLGNMTVPPGIVASIRQTERVVPLFPRNEQTNWQVAR